MVQLVRQDHEARRVLQGQRAQLVLRVQRVRRVRRVLQVQLVLVRQALQGHKVFQAVLAVRPVPLVLLDH